MVRVLSLSFLGSFLYAAALAAQPALLPGGMSTVDPAALRTEKASPLDEVLTGRSLFYRLPADAVKAARRSFVIRVSVNGRLFAEEAFHLRAGDGAPTVELLAFAPGLLDRLYEQARRPADSLTVTVLLDGRAVRELSWSEFLRASRQLQGEPGFHPVTVSSEVKSPLAQPAPTSQGTRPAHAKGLYPDPDCSASCDEALDFCLNYRCDPRGDDCTLCYNDYNNCISNCPLVCEEPKSYKDTTINEKVGETYQGYAGCYSAFRGLPGSYNYSYYQLTIKSTTTRVTTHCDGSTTSAVIGVSYSYVNCTMRGGTCAFPSGTMLNEC